MLLSCTTVLPSADAKRAIPGERATKLPAGNAVALLGSAVSPMPNRNVPVITVRTSGLVVVAERSYTPSEISTECEHLVLARIPIEIHRA